MRKESKTDGHRTTILNNTDSIKRIHSYKLPGKVPYAYLPLSQTRHLFKFKTLRRKKERRKKGKHEWVWTTCLLPTPASAFWSKPHKILLGVKEVKKPADLGKRRGLLRGPGDGGHPHGGTTGSWELPRQSLCWEVIPLIADATQSHAVWKTCF